MNLFAPDPSVFRNIANAMSKTTNTTGKNKSMPNNKTASNRPPIRIQSPAAAGGGRPDYSTAMGGSGDGSGYELELPSELELPRELERPSAIENDIRDYSTAMGGGGGSEMPFVTAKPVSSLDSGKGSFKQLFQSIPVVENPELAPDDYSLRNNENADIFLNLDKADRDFDKDVMNEFLLSLDRPNAPNTREWKAPTLHFLEQQLGVELELEPEPAPLVVVRSENEYTIRRLENNDSKSNPLQLMSRIDEGSKEITTTTQNAMKKYRADKTADKTNGSPTVGALMPPLPSIYLPEDSTINEEIMTGYKKGLEDYESGIEDLAKMYKNIDYFFYYSWYNKPDNYCSNKTEDEQIEIKYILNEFIKILTKEINKNSQPANLRPMYSKLIDKMTAIRDFCDPENRFTVARDAVQATKRAAAERAWDAEVTKEAKRTAKAAAAAEAAEAAEAAAAEKTTAAAEKTAAAAKKTAASAAAAVAADAASAAEAKAKEISNKKHPELDAALQAKIEVQALIDTISAQQINVNSNTAEPRKGFMNRTIIDPSRAKFENAQAKANAALNIIEQIILRAQRERDEAERKVQRERDEAERKRKEAERKAQQEIEEVARKAQQEREEAARKREEAERKAQQEREESERKAQREIEEAERKAQREIEEANKLEFDRIEKEITAAMKKVVDAQKEIDDIIAEFKTNAFKLAVNINVGDNVNVVMQPLKAAANDTIVQLEGPESIIDANCEIITKNIVNFGLISKSLSIDTKKFISDATETADSKRWSHPKVTQRRIDAILDSANIRAERRLEIKIEELRRSKIAVEKENLLVPLTVDSIPEGVDIPMAAEQWARLFFLYTSEERDDAIKMIRQLSELHRTDNENNKHFVQLVINFKDQYDSTIVGYLLVDLFRGVDINLPGNKKSALLTESLLILLHTNDNKDIDNLIVKYYTAHPNIAIYAAKELLINLLTYALDNGCDPKRLLYREKNVYHSIADDMSYGSDPVEPVECLDKLYSEFPEGINATDKDNQTVLGLAVKRSKLEMVKWLISKGVNLIYNKDEICTLGNFTEPEKTKNEMKKLLSDAELRKGRRLAPPKPQKPQKPILNNDKQSTNGVDENKTETLTPNPSETRGFGWLSNALNKDDAAVAITPENEHEYANDEDEEGSWKIVGRDRKAKGGTRARRHRSKRRSTRKHKFFMPSLFFFNKMNASLPSFRGVNTPRRRRTMNRGKRARKTRKCH